MNPFYAEMKSMADELITEFDGRQTPMQLIRSPGGAVSDSTGSFVPGTPETLNVVGVIFSQNKENKVPTTVQRKSFMALLRSDVAPTAADELLADGIKYQVKSFEALKPSDTVLLYKVELER